MYFLLCLFTLTALLLDFTLKFCDETIKLINLTILVLQLALESSIILRLFFAGIYFKDRFKFFNLLKSTPYFRFILNLHDFSQTLQFFCELGRARLLLNNNWSLLHRCFFGLLCLVFPTRSLLAPFVAPLLSPTIMTLIHRFLRVIIATVVRISRPATLRFVIIVAVIRVPSLTPPVSSLPSLLLRVFLLLLFNLRLSFLLLLLLNWSCDRDWVLSQLHHRFEHAKWNWLTRNKVIECGKLVFHLKALADASILCTITYTVQIDIIFVICQQWLV